MKSHQGVKAWINRPNTKRILLSFSIPKTPMQVSKELGIKKVKVKPYIEEQLLVQLNPQATKGRMYVLSARACTLLKLPITIYENTDWNLIGWIKASPKQRLLILKTMALDSIKRTSESIRKRSSSENPCLSRISTKEILKELISERLIHTERHTINRYYWISNKGKNIQNQLSNSLTSDH